jgi:hypothetical protein
MTSLALRSIIASIGPSLPSIDAIYRHSTGHAHALRPCPAIPADRMKTVRAASRYPVDAHLTN